MTKESWTSLGLLTFHIISPTTYEEEILTRDPKFSITQPITAVWPRCVVAIEEALNNQSGGEVSKLMLKHACLTNKSWFNKEGNFPKEHRVALQNIRTNKDIVVLKGDKGNATVLMNAVDVKNKVLLQLQDTSHFKALTDDPTPKFKKIVKACTKGLGQSGAITEKQQVSLLQGEHQHPFIFQTIKQHKEDAPLRIITVDKNNIN